jgi:hypothetical protein
LTNVYGDFLLEILFYNSIWADLNILDTFKRLYMRLRRNDPPLLSQDAPTSYSVDDATVVESAVSLSASFSTSVHLV